MECGERLRFASSLPVGFADLLALGRNETAGAIDAYLFLPETVHGPLPLVITSVGSLGLASGREELYARAFCAAGIAMLVVDSFGSRGFAETFSDQGRISLATSCADVLHALGHVARDLRFDPARIALFGYSRGGCAVVLSNDERLQQAVLGPQTRFAAYVALYPSVWLRWANPQPTDGPTLIVIGHDDIMAPPSLVWDRAERLRAAGAPVETLVLEGASHSFDANEPLSFKPEVNMCDCEVVIADDGSMRESTTGQRLEDDWSDFVARLRDTCGKRGAATGYGPHSRTIAVEPVVSFLKRALA